ncbi:hypothetical protein [Aestuariibacter salexigens]|uniref:hypothetical protein n=1 Tax=Aestuariibacter salexigens TaxID=226010 RepID=UPI0003F6A05B|nr:hypothetical protein [Aestuariibacter salexigens]
MQDLTDIKPAESQASSPSQNKIRRLQDKIPGIEQLRALWEKITRREPKPRPRISWGEKFRQLSVSQWLYFAAFIYMLNSSTDSNWADGDIITIGLIAGVGLARELWHLFQKMWYSMLGRGVIVVLYAATANFALAIAALKVNAIAGVEPTPLKFTIGFTTLIMLPMWIFAASVVFSSMLLMIGNLWSLFSLLLRIVRIRVPIHWEDRSFAGFSMLLRLILLPFVIAAIFSVTEPYLKQIYVFESPLQIVKTEIGAGVAKELEGLSDEERLVKLRELQQAGVIEMSEFNSVVDVVEDQEEEPRSLTIDRLIAGFIYQLETYPYSTCRKADNQRVLTLDEYSMLVSERDDSELGYKFSIQACVQVHKEIDG